MEKHHKIAAIAILLTVTGYGPLQLLAKDTETDTSFYQIFEKALDMYHHEEFDEAIRLASLLRERYPEAPAGVFALLTTYQTMMRNYRVRTYEAQYDSLLDLAIELSKKAIKKNRKDGRNYFYLGCAYGSRSIYYARRRKWMDAFRDGSQVLKNFRKAVVYSPDFYDAYYGLGLYKYWLGAKAKLLHLLPFVKNKRKEGIEQIKLAAEKGRFLKVESHYGLIAVYYNEGRFEEALEISNKVYALYPGNPSLLYRRARIFQALQRWNEALQTLTQLQTLLTNCPLKSISYQIECLYQMAKSHYHLGDYLEAQRLCEQAIALEQKCDFSKELDGPLEKFSDIKKQLHQLNKKVQKVLLVEAKRR